MSARDHILQLLRTTKNEAVERIVETALAHADSAHQKQLADVLLSRNRRPGWIALVRNFDRLPPDLQEYLLEHPRELFGPLTDAMDDDSGSGRPNVIEIVRKAADPKLVFLLTDALADRREEIRQLAARSLVEAIRLHRSGAAAPHQLSGPVPDSHLLRRAVEVALRQFKLHRQPDIVLAALLFERQQDSPLWPLFTDPHDEATRTAHQLLRAFTDPMLAPAVLLGLASPLKAAAVGGLTFCDRPEITSALARESYRLLDPLLRQSAQGIARPRLLPETTETVPWDATNPLDWLRLIDSLGLPPEQKLAWFKRLAESLEPTPPHRGLRMLLLRALAALPLDDAYRALVPYTCDPDEAVARSATRYLLARKSGEWRAFAGTMLRSPHAAVRKLISLAVTPGQFERLWQQYSKLPPAVQLNTTRALSVNDAQFPELLRSKLASPSPFEIAQGLRMLAALTQLAPYREAIIALCGHPDPHVAAMAVRLIGRLEDPRLHDLLEAAARHPDPRVRANAVESMAQLRIADRSAQVLALLNSRFNRERANAIRAISQFDFATARECLLKMLNDPSPHHRVSALWVVGQLNLLDIVKTVASMARRDPHMRVRKHATELLEKVHEAAAATVAG